MAKIKFDQRDQADVAYAVLSVPYSQRKDVRAAAAELGNPKLVEFDKPSSEWRLIEAQAKGVGVKKIDDAFAKWQTPEMVAQCAQEKSELAEKRAAAEVSVPKAKAKDAEVEQIEPARLFYPVANEKNERPEWKAALAKIEQETGVKPDIAYSAKQGAFVHKSGPTEGLESFQTPEAKAAWDAKGKTVSRSADSRRENAESALEASAFEAKGQHLMAASVKGLSMPSTEHAEQRTAVQALIKGASNEELTMAFNTTEVEKKRQESKLYGIQLSVAERNAAQAKGSALSADEKANVKADFNKLSQDERVKSVGRVLKADEFGQMVGVRSGFFALRTEMADRGLIQTKEKAQDIKAGQEQQSDAKAKEPVGRSKAQAPAKRQSLAAQLAQGTGR